MIPREVLDDILNKSDIVAIVSEYVPLKKAGRHYKGLCPFHQEKTPSFMVSSEKQIYHCFGCAAGGNAFGFLMKMENLNFPEAIEKLAKQTGVDISRFEKNQGIQKDEKEILYKVNRYAAWFYREALKGKNGELCRNYLDNREIKPETIEDFQLGYAPSSWEGLTAFLKSKNVPLEHAEKLGLIKKRKEGSYYDFFRHRLMFPILDSEGRVLGFSGRSIESGKDGSAPQVPQGSVSPRPTEAKYINSPESPIYFKGNSIYGLFQAKKSLRETREAILVEGNVDLIRLHQVGFKNTLAPLGTALTLPQIKTVGRFAEKFTLMFDGDSAGVKATLRAVQLFFEAGFHPKILALPPKEDPDSWVQKTSKEKIDEAFEKTPLAIEWVLSHFFSLAGTELNQRIQAAKQIMPLVQMIPSSLEQKSYAGKVAQYLGISASDLIGLLKEKENAENKPLSLQTQKISLERILLQLYVKDPKRLNTYLDDNDFLLFEDKNLQQLALLLSKQFQEKGVLNLSIFSDPDSPFNKLMGEIELGDFLFDVDDEKAYEQMMFDCLNEWKKRCLKKELQKNTADIQLAELAKDKIKITQLLSQNSDITKRLKELSKKTIGVE